MEFKDLTTALDAVNTVTNTIAANVDAVVAHDVKQLAELQALRDQIAAGTPVTQEQLDTTVAAAQARVVALQAVSDTLTKVAADFNDPIPSVPPPIAPADAPSSGASGSAVGG